MYAMIAIKKQGVNALDVQLKQQKESLVTQADQQKKAFNMQALLKS